MAVTSARAAGAVRQGAGERAHRVAARRRPRRAQRGARPPRGRRDREVRAAAPRGRRGGRPPARAVGGRPGVGVRPRLRRAAPAPAARARPAGVPARPTGGVRAARVRPHGRPDRQPVPRLPGDAHAADGRGRRRRPAVRRRRRALARPVLRGRAALGRTPPRPGGDRDPARGARGRSPWLPTPSLPELELGGLDPEAAAELLPDGIDARRPVAAAAGRRRQPARAARAAGVPLRCPARRDRAADRAAADRRTRRGGVPGACRRPLRGGAGAAPRRRRRRHRGGRHGVRRGRAGSASIRAPSTSSRRPASSASTGRGSRSATRSCVRPCTAARSPASAAARTSRWPRCSAQPATQARRAWHRAAAATGPRRRDRSRPRRRSAPGAPSAARTPPPPRRSSARRALTTADGPRGQQLLDAAEASWRSGRTEHVIGLIAQVRPLLTEDRDHAALALLEGSCALERGALGEGFKVLMEGARRAIDAEPEIALQLCCAPARRRGGRGTRRGRSR